MPGKTKGFLVCLLVAGLCFVVPNLGKAADVQAVQRLYQDSFPCDTFPSKCPESVGFLLQLKDLFAGQVIDIQIDERIDIDGGFLCSELYIQAGGNLTVPVDGINAELFYIRGPGDEWSEHLATGLQVNDVSVGGSARLRGTCIGFLPINIPIGGAISMGSLAAVSRTAVWLDTATDKVFLTDEYSGVAIGHLNFDFGLGSMIHGLIFPFIYAAIRDGVVGVIEDDGLVFNLVEGIMNALYHAKPCGCMVLPSHGAHPPAGHILVNLAVWFVPVGLVAFLRRKAGR